MGKQRDVDAVAAHFELTKAATRCFDVFLKRSGLTKKAALSRVVTWFTERDETSQAIIVGQIASAAAPDVADVIVREREAEQPEHDERDETQTALRLPRPLRKNIAALSEQLRSSTHDAIITVLEAAFVDGGVDQARRRINSGWSTRKLSQAEALAEVGRVIELAERSERAIKRKRGRK